MSKYHKDVNEEQIKLMEKLADIEHIRWADWQKYMHTKGIPSADNLYLMIPLDYIKHWKRQIKTDYKDLSEQEKDSDREQVVRYFDLVK